MNLRASFLIAVLISLSLALSACGFRLRGSGSVELPPQLRKVLVVGIPNYDPLLFHLQESLTFSGGTLTANPAEAELILQIYESKMRRNEISITQRGTANEYELDYRLDYELRTKDGKAVLPRDTLELNRDYFNPQIDVIGKAEEESDLMQGIYKEAVRTILRRAQLVLSSTP